VGSPVRIDQPVTWLIGLWLLVVAAVAIVALLDLWSAAEQVQQLAVKAAAPGTANPQPLFPTISVLQLQFTLTPDLSIILLAMVCGVLGSLVHVFTRLTESGGTNHGTDHPPRGRDALWFVAAPIQGGLLAFLAIAAVAAGLLSTGQSSSSFSANLFTVAAIAGLTGLFTKRMTVRLAAIINGVTGIRTSTLPAGNLPPPNGAAPQPRPDASEPSPH
jgi:hypothetical protein